MKNSMKKKQKTTKPSKTDVMVMSRGKLVIRDLEGEAWVQEMLEMNKNKPKTVPKEPEQERQPFTKPYTPWELSGLSKINRDTGKLYTPQELMALEKEHLDGDVRVWRWRDMQRKGYVPSKEEQEQHDAWLDRRQYIWLLYDKVFDRASFDERLLEEYETDFDKYGPVHADLDRQRELLRDMEEITDNPREFFKEMYGYWPDV